MTLKGKRVRGAEPSGQAESAPRVLPASRAERKSLARKRKEIMATALAHHARYMQESGFSDQQVQSLARFIEERAEQTEKKVVTKMDLNFQIEKMKNHLIIQAVGIVLASLGLLGWYINRVDNKTRLYVEARFDQQKTRFNDFKDSVNMRFDAQDQRFADFKGNVNMRFDKIEGDIKEIRTLVLALSRDGFSRKPAHQ